MMNYKLQPKWLMLATLTLGLMGSETQAQTKGQGINIDFMDTTVPPQQDFFRFVNGTWLDQTEIPGDRTRWGSFASEY
jgi:putative endopeptidase